MFLQPVLTGEELEAYKRSYCAYRGDEASARLFTQGCLATIELLSSGIIDYKDTRAQGAITIIRMENEAYAFQPPKHLAPYQEMALCLQSPLNHGPLGPCPGLKRVIEELDPLFEMIVAGYDRASYEERMPMLQKVEPSDSKLRDDDEEKDEYASALISYSNSKLDSRLARMVNNLSIDAMVILFQAATRRSWYEKRLGKLTSPNRNLIYCDCCGKNENIKDVCSACKVRRYCSVECQKKDWKERHKSECKLFREVMAVEIPERIKKGLDALAARSAAAKSKGSKK